MTSAQAQKKIDDLTKLFWGGVEDLKRALQTIEKLRDQLRRVGQEPEA